MKCKRCGAEGILVNDQSPRYKIYKCPNWEKKTCDYGCFLEVGELSKKARAKHAKRVG